MVCWAGVEQAVGALSHLAPVRAGLTVVMMAWNQLEGRLPLGMGNLPLQVRQGPLLLWLRLDSVPCMAHGI